jgi:sterol desaturase/sphingolipid hydroxylase (fatty acid hydroxylase superfamily)
MKIFQYLFYPLVVLYAFFCPYLLLDIFIEENYFLIPLLALIPFILFSIFLENSIPFRKEWIKSKGDLITDLVQSFVTLPVGTKLGELVLPFLLYYPLLWISESKSLNILNGLSQFGIFFITLLACEFGYYWIHRCAHRNHYLWKLHAVHHGAKRVYWGNSGRFHLVDAFISSFGYFIPIILIGPSAEIIILIIVFSAITGFMEHVNINFKAGILNYFFNTAQLHRWHHSEKEKESNNNFGKVLIIWDLLFGTFYLPKAKTVGQVGIENEKVPTDFWGQFRYPFK